MRRRTTALSLTRKHERKTDRVLQTIRRLAVKQRREKPQIFVSIRDAALRFGVPVSTMAAIYHRLIDEGILSTVRASRTILLGRETSHTLKVRGLIGMPLSGPRLHTSREYRECSLHLQEQLHARKFLVEPFYFEEEEIDPNVVVERSKREKIDLLIWLLPDRANRNTALRLSDLGLRFVGVNIGGLHEAFCRYEVRWWRAILTILDEWRADAELKGTIIALAGHETVAEMKQMVRLREMIAATELDCQLMTVPEGRIVRFLQSVCANKNIGNLLPAPAAEMFGTRAPDVVTKILKTRRIALIDGRPDLPFGPGMLDVTIDLVSVDWGAISERIARDILSGDAFRQSETTIFEAEAHLQVPLFTTLPSLARPDSATIPGRAARSTSLRDVARNAKSATRSPRPRACHPEAGAARRGTSHSQMTRRETLARFTKPQPLDICFSGLGNSRAIVRSFAVCAAQDDESRAQYHSPYQL